MPQKPRVAIWIWVKPNQKWEVHSTYKNKTDALAFYNRMPDSFIVIIDFVNKEPKVVPNVEPDSECLEDFSSEFPDSGNG